MTRQTVSDPFCCERPKSCTKPQKLIEKHFLPARSFIRLQGCFVCLSRECGKAPVGTQFYFCREDIFNEGPVWTRQSRSADWDVHYKRHDNLLTYNNTSPPPRSFDCKWGHIPLLEIINYTLFQKENIRLNITPPMLTVLFQEVCERTCANAHAYVTVLTLAGHWLIGLKMKLLP